jgi:competence ComEA-like helix-hairpin-helix protein
VLTTDEIRALAVLSALVALGTVLGWIDARHPRILELTLGDSLALGAVSGATDPGESPPDSAPPRSPARPAPATPGDPAEPGAYAVDGRLDLNRASAEELETLPGVGPKTAARIVEDRARRGRFRTARDLGRVKGIGPKTLARLLPSITVVPAARPPAPAGAVPAPRRGAPVEARTDTSAAPGAAAR